MKIELPVSLRINRPRAEVFSTLTTPDRITRFLCSAMSGEWIPGRKVIWHFDSAPAVELEVQTYILNEELSFYWNAYGSEERTMVRFTFHELGPSETSVRILETGWTLSQEAIMSALDHACGWENTLCSLKAWIEHGVDLRK